MGSGILLHYLQSLLALPFIPPPLSSPSAYQSAQGATLLRDKPPSAFLMPQPHPPTASLSPPFTAKLQGQSVGPIATSSFPGAPSHLVLHEVADSFCTKATISLNLVVSSQAPFFLFLFFFLEKGEGKEKVREGNNDM